MTRTQNVQVILSRILDVGVEPMLVKYAIQTVGFLYWSEVAKVDIFLSGYVPIA